MSSMSVSGVGTGAYSQRQEVLTAPSQEEQDLAGAIRAEQESQPDLTEMMKDAREQAAEREKMFQIPKNSRRYGDAAMIAY